jgi:SAM-dependent methyltransferase
MDMFNIHGQVMSGKLQALSNEELVNLWQGATTDDTFTMYYASILTGKSFIDIGSGLARQTLQFVLHGAYGTFVDIVESNLEIVRRVAVSLGVGHRVSTILFVSLPQLQSELGDEMFDAVCAFGSLHHTPREIIQEQSRLLRDHLKPGGLWIQLALVFSPSHPNLLAPPLHTAASSLFCRYPISRFTAALSNQYQTFDDGGWGGDNDHTPWAEW